MVLACVLKQPDSGGEAGLSGCLGPLAKPCSLSGVSRQPSVRPGGAPLEAGGPGLAVVAEQGYTQFP